MGIYEIKSYKTKRLLADAFIQLVLTKPIKKITAQELVNNCGLNRQTFYYHFKDIFALADWTVMDMTSALIKKRDPSIPLGTDMLTCLRYVKENRDFLLALYSSFRSEGINKNVYHYIHDMLQSAILAELVAPKVKKSDLNFITHFYTVALIGLADSWIVNGFDDEPEEVAEKLMGIIEGGLKPTLDYFSSKY